MPNQKNIKLVEDLSKKVAEAKSIVFAEYSGLDANTFNELRQAIRETGAEVTIAKNTLMKLALNREDAEALLEGQLCAIFSYEDAYAPLKTLMEFIKAHKLPVVKAGIFEEGILSAERLVELSKLPSREELIAQVIGGLKAPLRGLTNVLSGPQRKLVYALSAIADKKNN